MFVLDGRLGDVEEGEEGEERVGLGVEEEGGEGGTVANSSLNKDCACVNGCTKESKGLPGCVKTVAAACLRRIKQWRI